MILIVETYPNLAEIIATYLNEHGLSALPTKSYEEALEIIENKEVSILVSEHKTDCIDGKDLAAQTLKRHPLAKTILTSSQLPSPALRDGVDESTKIIFKPFTPSQLLQLIKESMREERQKVA